MKYAAFAFPAGSSGAALLLLRGSVVSFLLASAGRVSPSIPILAISLLALAGLIALGMITRIASAIAVLGAALLAAFGGWAWLPTMLAHGLAAAALAALGPGAFSVDGRRFGRRTVRLSGSDGTTV